MEEHNYTNVEFCLFGRESACSIAVDGRLERFIACTMDIQWRLAKDRLGGIPVAVLMLDTMEEHMLEKQLQELPECETFVGIGGDKAVDMAKYLSGKRGKTCFSYHLHQCGCICDSISGCAQRKGGGLCGGSKPRSTGD